MTKGNDTAFSRAGFALSPDDYDLGADGLTKREYFAAVAMQGLLADSNNLGAWGVYARMATAAADALIEALNQPEEK